MKEIRELHGDEIDAISGGDWQTWNWGRMVGSALGGAWNSMKEYAASDESSTDVIVYLLLWRRMPGTFARHLPFSSAEPTVQPDHSRGNRKNGDFYIFRIKKRDIHLLCVIAFLWFLWSQGGEMYILLSNLILSFAR